MTINEIKELAKKLKEEDVEKIKAEIKSKEAILKTNDLDEEELGQVLNTLFSILVIEKAIEEEVEGLEDIKDELEQDLIESYEKYDDYMVKFKKQQKEEKKKKKRWLLNFLTLSEDIRNKKGSIRETDKLINNMQNQINTLKKQATDSNLKEACKHDNEHARDFMRDTCDRCGDELHRGRHHRENIEGRHRHHDHERNRNREPRHERRGHPERIDDINTRDRERPSVDRDNPSIRTRDESRVPSTVAENISRENSRSKKI